MLARPHHKYVTLHRQRHAVCMHAPYYTYKGNVFVTTTDKPITLFAYYYRLLKNRLSLHRTFAYLQYHGNHLFIYVLVALYVSQQ